MARGGQIQFALPEFSGTTRKLVLWNLGAFFLLLIVSATRIVDIGALIAHLGLYPPNTFSGEIWQLATYSFIHPGLLGTAFELLSLWLLGGLLEAFHGPRWLAGLYWVSVLGTAVAALLLYAFGLRTGMTSSVGAITGCMGGIFGMLVAIGVLHGDLEFLLFFVLNIKAKYLAAIYLLVSLAQMFGGQRFWAFAQLGGALAAWLYLTFAPRRGWGFSLSESWYGLRNRYYRWKRRRAAAKFQVYMRKQGRTMRFDGRGHLIDEDQEEINDPNDRTRWN